jgi:hypothetical protein
MTYPNNRAHPLRRIGYLLPVAALALASCVSGAPTLNEDQEHRVATLTVYPPGQLPARPYKELAALTAADCSGAPLGGRVWGNVDRALETLKRKAAAINADSIIDVSCGAAPLLNNCWSAQKCTGRAVSFSDAPQGASY